MKERNFFKAHIAPLIGLIALVAVIGFSVVGCESPKEDESSTGSSGTGNGNSGSGGIKPTITIKNSTGYTVDGWNGGLWIKPSTQAQSWGSSLIGGYSDQMEDGTSRKFTFSQPLSAQSVYDFRFNGGGYSFRKYGVTISNGMTITFTTSDLNDGSAQPEITIQNRSGKTFNSVHIKPSVISDWGSSFGSVSNNSDGTFTILIPPSNYTVFDIQMKSSNPTNTYTRNNVTVSNGMKLIFTSADADNPTIELPVIVIQNNTGYTIDGWNGGLWIKSSTTTGWGNSFISGYSDQMQDGILRTFSLPQYLSVQSVYDIRIKAGGFTFTKYNLTVSEGMIVTFTTSDKE